MHGLARRSTARAHSRARSRGTQPPLSAARPPTRFRQGREEAWREARTAAKAEMETELRRLVAEQAAAAEEKLQELESAREHLHTQLAAADGQMVGARRHRLGRGSLATALLGESRGTRPAWHYAFLGWPSLSFPCERRGRACVRGSTHRHRSFAYTVLPLSAGAYMASSSSAVHRKAGPRSNRTAVLQALVEDQRRSWTSRTSSADPSEPSGYTRRSTWDELLVAYQYLDHIHSAPCVPPVRIALKRMHVFGVANDLNELVRSS